MMTDFENERAETLTALYDLVRDGHMTPGQAVTYFRHEYRVSFTFCIDFGVVSYLRQASRERSTR